MTTIDELAQRIFDNPDLMDSLSDEDLTLIADLLGINLALACEIVEQRLFEFFEHRHGSGNA